MLLPRAVPEGVLMGPAADPPPVQAVSAQEGAGGVYVRTPCQWPRVSLLLRRCVCGGGLHAPSASDTESVGHAPSPEDANVSLASTWGAMTGQER